MPAWSCDRVPTTRALGHAPYRLPCINELWEHHKSGRTSQQTLEIPYSCVTLNDGLWETEKWGDSVASAPLPRHAKYPPVTNVCQIYQPWEHGQKRHVETKYDFSQIFERTWVPTSIKRVAAIAQSVQRIATDLTVGRSNPGGCEIFRVRPDRPWGPPSLLYNGCRVFPGGKAAGAWPWLPTPTWLRG